MAANTANVRRSLVVTDPGQSPEMFTSSRPGTGEFAATAAASSAEKSAVFEWIFIEQNFGPHMEQKCASLNPSSGSVSSCIERAVSGSSDNANCRFQSKL